MEAHISKISNFTRKIGALWRFCPFNFQLSFSGKTRRLRNSAKWPRSVATATDQEKKTNCLSLTANKGQVKNETLIEQFLHSSLQSRFSVAT